MVTMEVNLTEKDEEPEQHLDEGEFIERRVVPLTELYDTLHGTLSFHTLMSQANRWVTALSKEEGKIVDAR